MNTLIAKLCSEIRHANKPFNCQYFSAATFRTNNPKQGRLAGPLSSLPQIRCPWSVSSLLSYFVYVVLSRTCLVCNSCL